MKKCKFLFDKESTIGCFTLLWNFIKLYHKSLILIIWPLICLPIMINSNTSWDSQASSKFRCLYCIAVLAMYWIAEVIPISLTGLIPVFAFPLLRIMSLHQTAICYLYPTNMLFMSSIMVSYAIEHSNLHKRIALLTVKLVGCNPWKLHFGISTITCVLSLFMMNSACTAMMCPIVKAILVELEKQGMTKSYDVSKSTTTKPSSVTTAFYLGICFSATTGGMGTLVGTATNVAYKGLIENNFGPHSKDEDIIEFLPWMLFNLPLVLVLNALTIVWLQILFMDLFKKRDANPEIKEAELGNSNKIGQYDFSKEKYKEIGPMTWHQFCVASLFLFLVIAWITRKSRFFSGWEHWITPEWEPKLLHDAVPSIICIFLLCVIPAKPKCFYSFSGDPGLRPTEISPPLVPWKELQEHMPWGLLFLIGSGVAISEAGKLENTGMSQWIGQKLKDFLQEVRLIKYPYCIMCILTVLTSMLTEITSNVSICNLVIPIVFNIASEIKVNPLLLGNPIALASSHAYMLPAGTPSNAYTAEYVNLDTKDMIKAGFLVKLVAFIMTIVLFITYGKIFWQIDTFPEWAFITSNYSMSNRDLNKLVEIILSNDTMSV